MFFIVRWLANSLALWLAFRLLTTSYFADSTAGIATFLGAGLVLSLVNAIIKPIIVILSLPAIVLTMGLFMLIVNGTMVYITILLVPLINISFWGAVVAGAIVSLVNYVLSEIIDRLTKPRSASA